MSSLPSAARTVVELGKYLEHLKAQALEIYNPQAITARGYIPPSNEIRLRHRANFVLENPRGPVRAHHRNLAGSRADRSRDAPTIADLRCRRPLCWSMPPAFSAKSSIRTRSFAASSTSPTPCTAFRPADVRRYRNVPSRAPTTPGTCGKPPATTTAIAQQLVRGRHRRRPRAARRNHRPPTRAAAADTLDLRAYPHACSRSAGSTPHRSRRPRPRPVRRARSRRPRAGGSPRPPRPRSQPAEGNSGPGCPIIAAGRRPRRPQGLLRFLGPDLSDPGDVEPLVCNRLGAVVDQEYEGQSERQQAEESQQETDHGIDTPKIVARLSLTPVGRLVQCAVLSCPVSAAAS